MRALLLPLLLLLLAPAWAQDPEDAVWLARLPVGPIKPGPLAWAGIPADKNPKKVFPQANGFVNGAGYIWMSSMTAMVEDYPGGPVSEKRSNTQWYFLPNGRFYYIGMSYAQGAQPKKVAAYGRYTIANETVQFETDGGETGTMQLAYGRRNLVWGETTYGEVNWENEALRRQQNQ